MMMIDDNPMFQMLWEWKWLLLTAWGFSIYMVLGFLAQKESRLNNMEEEIEELYSRMED